MNRNESDEEQALQESTKILNLKSGDTGKDLRKAYRMMARKYHPDKVRILLIVKSIS
jgi:preprotein translocase subunit Sec63